MPLHPGDANALWPVLTMCMVTYHTSLELSTMVSAEYLLPIEHLSCVMNTCHVTHTYLWTSVDMGMLHVHTQPQVMMCPCFASPVQMALPTVSYIPALNLSQGC